MPKKINMSDKAFQRIQSLLYKLLLHACQDNLALRDLHCDEEPTSLPIKTRWCIEDRPRIIVRATMKDLIELALEDQLDIAEIRSNLGKFRGDLRQDLSTLKTLRFIEDNRTELQGSPNYHFNFLLWQVVR